MLDPRQRRRRAFLVTAALGLVGLVVLGTYLMTPKLKTASDAQVRSWVDPRLLVPPPKIDGGLERFEQFTRLVKSITDNHPKGTVGDPPLDPDSAEVKQLVAVLESGPMQRPPSDPTSIGSFGGSSNAKFCAKQWVARIKVDASKLKWEAVESDFEIAYLMAQRVRESGAGLIDQFVSMALDGILNQEAFKVASDPKSPPSLGRRLLELVRAPADTDIDFQRALVREFQNTVYPRLGDISRIWEPYSKAGEAQEIYGNYDPKASAKMESDLFEEFYENTSLPLSKQSSVQVKKVEKLRDSVPELPDSDNSIIGFAKHKWYAIQMNWIPNSMGITCATGFGASLGGASTKFRTTTNRLRTAIAFHTFQRERGREPKAYQELIGAKLLDREPVDYGTGATIPFDATVIKLWKPKS